MTTTELEQAIVNQYDNGRYTTLGADGGSLRYIMVNIYGINYWCDITVDHDIAKIRRVWRIQARDEKHNNLDSIHNYNMVDKYYELRV